MRYYVANCDLIPLREQPTNGYTKLGAVERAQRLAEHDAKMFDEPISYTREFYHIIDETGHYCVELDDAI